MNNDFDRVKDNLISECEKYQKLLLEEIATLSQNLPEDVQQDYLTETALDPKKIIERANTGRSLLWSNEETKEKYTWEKHSSELYPKLHATISKYNLISKLVNLLNRKGEPEVNIQAFNSAINKREVQREITKDNDTAGIRFLKIVKDIVSRQFSKISEKGLRFWKTAGEKFLERTDKITKEAPSTKLSKK